MEYLDCIFALILGVLGFGVVTIRDQSDPGLVRATASVLVSLANVVLLGVLWVYSQCSPRSFLELVGCFVAGALICAAGEGYFDWLIGNSDGWF